MPSGNSSRERGRHESWQCHVQGEMRAWAGGREDLSEVRKGWKDLLLLHPNLSLPGSQGPYWASPSSSDSELPNLLRSEKLGKEVVHLFRKHSMMERGEIRAGIINSQHINSYPLCLALCICKMGIIPFTLEGSWWGVNEIMFLKSV